MIYTDVSVPDDNKPVSEPVIGPFHVFASESVIFIKRITFPQITPDDCIGKGQDSHLLFFQDSFSSETIFQDDLIPVKNNFFPEGAIRQCPYVAVNSRNAAGGFEILNAIPKPVSGNGQRMAAQKDKIFSGRRPRATVIQRIGIGKLFLWNSKQVHLVLPDNFQRSIRRSGIDDNNFKITVRLME